MTIIPAEPRRYRVVDFIFDDEGDAGEACIGDEVIAWEIHESDSDGIPLPITVMEHYGEERAFAIFDQLNGKVFHAITQAAYGSIGEFNARS